MTTSLKNQKPLRRYVKRKICGKCVGTGITEVSAYPEHGYHKVTCTTCQGSGMVDITVLTFIQPANPVKL